MLFSGALFSWFELSTHLVGSWPGGSVEPSPRKKGTLVIPQPKRKAERDFWAVFAQARCALTVFAGHCDLRSDMPAYDIITYRYI